MMKVSHTSYDVLDKKEDVRWTLAALRLRTFVLGLQHQRTIEALAAASMALFTDSQFDKAQELGKRAVQLIEVAPDCPPYLIARKFEIQGYLRMALGELPDEYISRALEIRVAEVSSIHPDIVRLRLRLSESYREQGRYAEFEELAREVIESYQRVSGSTELDALRAKAWLAFHSAVAGRDTEALGPDEEAAACEASERKAHNVYMIMACLGRVQYQASVGNIAEAVKSGMQMIEHSSKLFHMSSIPEPMILVMELVALLYQKIGQHVEAEKVRIQAITHRMKTETEDSPKVIRSIQALADLYEATGMPAKAKPLRKKLLKVGIKKLGRQSPTAILYSCQLGLNYSFQGQHDKAASYRYSVLCYPLESADARLPGNIELMASIAHDLNQNDDYIEAYKVASDAVRLARTHESATQPEFTDCLKCLAFTCSRLNKTREAEELYREAIDIMGSQNDKSDYYPYNTLLRTLTNLACLLLQEARYTEAEELAAATREKMLQLEYPDHEDITSNSRTLAAVYAEQGQYYLAELRCSDLLRYLDEKAWKPEHLTPSSILGAADGLETLALTYERAQRYQEASNIYEKTVAIRKQLKGSDSMHTLKAAALYRDTMNSQARYSEALELGLQCKELYQRGEKSATSFEEMILVHIDRGIAASYAGLRRYADAEPLVRQALETCSRITGRDHPQYLDCLAVLMQILLEKNDANLFEVKDMGVGLLKKWIAVVGEKHLKSAQAMESLAMTHVKIGDIDEAESLRRKAKEIKAGLDGGVEGEEEKELDDLVLRLLERWDAEKDELAEALARLKVG
jgi:tetratricopeptide (TPR) repeat protein